MSPSAPLPTTLAQVSFDTTSGVHILPYAYSAYVSAALAFMVLQWLAVLGRVYVRVFMVKAFGKDDVACIITLIITAAFNAIILTIWRITDIRPLAEIPTGNWLVAIQLTLAGLTMYIVATTSLKLALGLLLLRILVKRWMKNVIYGVMTITVIYATAYFFVVLFECGAPSHFPSRIILGQCLKRSTTDGLSYTHAVLTALADVTYAILPIIFLRDANLPQRAKISVGAILVLGSFGCICTFIRIGWIHYLTGATTTYWVTTRGIVLMSVIELSIGLVCISLATYRPLLNRCFHRRSLSYQYHSGQGGTHPSNTFSSRHSAPQVMAAPKKAQIPLGRFEFELASPLVPDKPSTDGRPKSVAESVESDYWQRPA